MRGRPWLRSPGLRKLRPGYAGSPHPTTVPDYSALPRYTDRFLRGAIMKITEEFLEKIASGRGGWNN
jgi:hypothetical protein